MAETPYFQQPIKLSLDAARRQSVGGRAEQNVARRGALLKARGKVDRLAGRERLLDLVEDDLAGFDADPGLETELVNALADRERGPCRALCIVLVRLRK